MFTEVSENPAASVFRIKILKVKKKSFFLWNWELCMRLHGTTSQKAVIFSYKDTEMCQKKVYKLVCACFPGVLKTHCRFELEKDPFNSSVVTQRNTCQHWQRGSATFPLKFTSFLNSLLYHFPLGQTYFKSTNWKGRRKKIRYIFLHLTTT